MADTLGFVLGDDAPKCVRSEDRLGHAAFARHVANVIRNVDAANGYVLGLHGAWGSGKSTTLNFIVEWVRDGRAEELVDDEVVVVDFRPWLITGHQDLMSAFLHVLFSKLGDSGQQSWWRRSWKSVKPWVTRAEAKGLTGAFAKVLASLAPPVVGHVAEKGLNAAVSALRSPPLQVAHQNMVSLLRQLNKRILVTVDDIDRLEADEIRTVMQMVKSLGKLPNVVYLLCYDREIVWPALDRAAGAHGPNFAEKIVQQELELPVPHRAALLDMLMQEIEGLLSSLDGTVRWGRIARVGLRRWLRSPRDVVRLCNAAKFSWAAIEDEIDPLDLLAMEGLRLFEAEVFEWVRDNRPLIFREDPFVGIDASTAKPVVKRLMTVGPEWARAELLELVAVLFPSVSKLLSPQPDAGGVVAPLSLGAWPVEEHVDCERRRGVGSEAGYDAYFGLHLSPDAVSLKELKWLVRATDAKDIEACLKRYVHDMKNRFGRPLIGDLLEGLYVHYHGKFGAEPLSAMLEALLAVGGDVVGMEGSDPEGSLFLVIREVLGRCGADEGGKALIEAFRTTESVAFLADLYVVRAREMGVLGQRMEGDRTCISEEDFGVLGDVLRERIEAADRADSLSKAPYFRSIVASWRHLCGPEGPHRWLAAGMQAESSFMVKVCRMLVATGREASGATYHMRGVPEGELYDIEALNERAIGWLKTGELTRDERNLLESVMNATGRMIKASVARAEMGSNPD